MRLLYLLIAVGLTFWFFWNREKVAPPMETTPVPTAPNSGARPVVATENSFMSQLGLTVDTAAPRPRPFTPGVSIGPAQPFRYGLNSL